MNGDVTFTKPWTVALTGTFAWPGGGAGPAVVIVEKGGGNVRLKKKGKVRWTNNCGRSIRLDFTDWPDDDGGAPDPVWPFSAHAGGQVDPNVLPLDPMIVVER